MDTEAFCKASGTKSVLALSCPKAAGRLPTQIMPFLAEFGLLESRPSFSFIGRKPQKRG